MSYRAVIELSLCIDSFRNVGMFQQGVYFLSYEIFYYKENKKIYATPYANIPFIYSTTNSKKNFRNIEPSEIVENSPMFKTRSFCIRFRHEEIPMNEVCQFRAEVDTDKNGDYLSTQFYVEVKLHFLRFKFGNGATLNFMRNLVEEERFNFKVVSTQNFKISGCFNGMTEYLPTAFKGVYFSVANWIIHAALTDFKWRKELLLSIEDGIDENGIYVETEKNLSVAEYQQMMYKYAYRPDSLMNYFLGVEKDFYVVKFNASTLENVFDIFVSPLILNWENLKRKYETVFNDKRESILDSKGPLAKIEAQCKNLEFWGNTSWKRYTDEEYKEDWEKENQPIEKEQADYREDSSEEGNWDVGEENEGVQ